MHRRRYCTHNANAISGLTSPRTLPEFWLSFMGAPKVELDQAINPVFFLVLCSVKEKSSIIPRLCQRFLKIMLILNRRIFQIITGSVTRFTLKK